MKQKLDDTPTKKNGSMLKQKTNEDYNKQEPNLKDPIQNKNHQEGVVENSTNQINVEKRSRSLKQK